jgi:uncharacterized membrane protein YeaQ/YmgE (transglycosylase-associated protein family)
VGLIGWIISGALAGWAVNVSVVGAVLGGLLYRMITGREINLEFDLPSFGIAVLGPVVLLGVLRLISTAGRVRR